MIVDDDVGGFLKFLDKVGLELACLLDIGGQQTGAARRSVSRQKISLTTKARTGKSRSATKSNHQRTQIKSDRQQTRTKGRRKNKSIADGEAEEELIAETNIQSIEADGMERMHHSSSSKHLQHSVQDLNQVSNKLQGIHHHHLQHHQQQQLLHQQLDDPVGDTQPFVDGQLTTLSIAVDELVPPLDHGTSISPSNHLSPLEATIQFNSSLHQQHYYPSQRMHLDSFHLQDEFSGHDQIPITASGSLPHLSGQDPLLQRHQHQLHQQHQRGNQHQLLIRDQPSVANSTSILRSDVLGDNNPTLSISADCYSQGHTIHHHHQQQQQQQPQPHYHSNTHHQQQLQHPHHQHHHQSIDQQWLSTASQHHNHHNHQQHHQTPDSTLQQLGAADSGPIDHVATLSPVAHQSLEQVQFTAPLYHPNYYNHQADQLDSFQQIGDDYNANQTSLSANSSSPIGSHLHRLQQENSQQQSPSQAHVRMSTVNVTNSSNNNNNNNANESGNGDNNEPTNNQNPYDREHDHQQHHHHHHHPMQPIHSQASGHQLHTLDTTYPSHHHHSHHQQLLHSHHHQQHQNNHHSHHHQMMPLLNGLEPNGVIIQDINLASASWASPEDLYSI